LVELRVLAVDMEVLTGDANFRWDRSAGEPGTDFGLQFSVRAGLTPAGVRTSGV
jgi:hypothetical protein